MRGGRQKCSTTPDLARFSRPRFALLRSPTGAPVAPREDRPADGTGVDCGRGANRARCIQPGPLRRYLGLARLSRHGLSLLDEEEEEEVWEEVTGIFKAVMSPQGGNVGGFGGRTHAGRARPPPLSPSPSDRITQLFPINFRFFFFAFFYRQL